MCNLRDIVKYRTPMCGRDNWGIVVEILSIEASVHERYKGSKLYRIQPIADETLGYFFVEENDVLESYSKYFSKEEE